MIKRLRIALDGPREALDRVAGECSGISTEIEDFPVRSVLRCEVVEGSPEHVRLQEALERYELDLTVDEMLEASSDELSTERFFVAGCLRWIDDCDAAVDPPAYTGSDRCPLCGKGQLSLARPLRGEWEQFRKHHFLRYPPGLVIVSSLFAEVFHRQGWTGAKLRPVVDRATGRESEDFHQLEITSVLPPMHPSAPIERSCIPQSCSVCRKLGYQLNGYQPVYSRSVADAALDINLSSEWLAPHYVSCPMLICSRSVVLECLRLEEGQRWLPIRWV